MREEYSPRSPHPVGLAHVVGEREQVRLLAGAELLHLVEEERAVIGLLDGPLAGLHALGPALHDAEEIHVAEVAHHVGAADEVDGPVGPAGVEVIAARQLLLPGAVGADHHHVHAADGGVGHLAVGPPDGGRGQDEALAVPLLLGEDRVLLAHVPAQGLDDVLERDGVGVRGGVGRERELGSVGQRERRRPRAPTRSIGRRQRPGRRCRARSGRTAAPLRRSPSARPAGLGGAQGTSPLAGSGGEIDLLIDGAGDGHRALGRRPAPTSRACSAGRAR